MHQVLLWVGFNLFVIGLLALDLGVFNRRAHVPSVKEALMLSAFWIALALLFGAGLYYFEGHEKGLQYLTGYLIEKSLSMDNLFVFLLLFKYFRVPGIYQHKVLFWGILGALIMRAAMILGGISLIHRFHWIIYVFGGFLVFTGIRMAFEKGTTLHLERNPVLRLTSRLLPVTSGYEGDHFVVRRDGRWMVTPLLVVLMVVETTDLIFALDSIPAILAISLDPFIVYSSNVFAILGLRALFFALAGLMRLFHYLHYGLSAILVFVGVKMLTSGVMEIPIVIALGTVAVLLAVSVAASLIWPSRTAEAGAEETPTG